MERVKIALFEISLKKSETPVYLLIKYRHLPITPLKFVKDSSGSQLIRFVIGSGLNFRKASIELCALRMYYLPAYLNYVTCTLA